MDVDKEREQERKRKRKLCPWMDGIPQRAKDNGMNMVHSCLKDQLTY
jgi:hypothetical protein